MDQHLLKLTIAFSLLLTVPLGAQEIGDPTKPPSYQQDEEVSLTTDDRVFEVTAILTSNDRRIAVINEERVEIGDWISGAQVLEIRRYEVILHGDNEIFSITLSGPTAVKTPVKTPASPRK